MPTLLVDLAVQAWCRRTAHSSPRGIWLSSQSGPVIEHGTVDRTGQVS